MIVGYARVSTDGQTLDAQQGALRAAGATSVFSEKVSGAKTDRAQLAKAIAALAEGDTLIVTKLDRLARSTRDLLNPRCNRQGRCKLPVIGRSVGRHHHSARSVDADCAGRTCGV
jgi:predicted site-specific integrase-resolvase